MRGSVCNNLFDGSGKDQTDELIDNRADDCRAGNRHDPCENHLLRHAPMHCIHALCRADTHDGAGNDMRRADGKMEEGRGEDNRRRVEIRRKA